MQNNFCKEQNIFKKHIKRLENKSRELLRKTHVTQNECISLAQANSFIAGNVAQHVAHHKNANWMQYIEALLEQVGGSVICAQQEIIHLSQELEAEKTNAAFHEYQSLYWQQQAQYYKSIVEQTLPIVATCSPSSSPAQTIVLRGKFLEIK